MKRTMIDKRVMLIVAAAGISILLGCGNVGPPFEAPPPPDPNTSVGVGVRVYYDCTSTDLSTELRWAGDLVGESSSDGERSFFKITQQGGICVLADDPFTSDPFFATVFIASDAQSFLKQGHWRLTVGDATGWQTICDVDLKANALNYLTLKTGVLGCLVGMR